MSKRAVVVGVNDYSGQTSLPPGWSVGNLSCCLADVQSMQPLLQSAFLFDQVKVLTDAAATRDAILQSIKDMLTASGPGDVACFVYSGHGGRFPADPADPGRYYEAIIPASGSPITDLEIYDLASQLDQSAVNFTLILDSCYSGGIHEDTPDSTIRSAGYSSGYVQTCTSAMGTVIPCGVALPPGNSALDGNVSNVVGQGNGVVCSVDDNKSLIPVSKTTVIAACRYDETATEQNGHGALTQGLLDSINQSNPSVSYLQLIDQLRDDLQNKLGVTQTPTLLGQENRQDWPVLAPWETSA